MSEGNYRVTEGTYGMWHYHISVSEDKKFTRSLCGKPAMITSIELSGFGKPFGDQFPKKPTWCAECAKLAKINYKESK